MWCWRRLEDISWTDHVRNAEVLHRVEWGINIVQNRQKRQERRRKQLLDDLEGNRRYCELK